MKTNLYVQLFTGDLKMYDLEINVYNSHKSTIKGILILSTMLLLYPVRIVLQYVL